MIFDLSKDNRVMSEEYINISHNLGLFLKLQRTSIYIYQGGSIVSEIIFKTSKTQECLELFEEMSMYATYDPEINPEKFV